MRTDSVIMDEKAVRCRADGQNLRGLMTACWFVGIGWHWSADEHEVLFGEAVVRLLTSWRSDRSGGRSVGRSPGLVGCILLSCH